MPYDNLISRTDAGALIPEEVSNDILARVTTESAVLSTFRKKNMGTKITRMPVKSALPTAYFRNGDTGLRQTTEVNWDNKYLNAEEIDCIVPIPETVMEDINIDVWEDIKPDIIEAFGITLDAAVAFGTNKPTSWGTALVPGAVAAGNVIARGKNSDAKGGFAQDVSDLMTTLEVDGHDAAAFWAAKKVRGYLRGARDTTGQKLEGISPAQIEGVNVRYPMPGMWPSGVNAAELIAGDPLAGIIGIRKDITFKVLDQAVITDNSNAIVYNLAQQGMVALMCTARFAWEVPNLVNRDNPDVATRFPFAVLRSPAS